MKLLSSGLCDYCDETEAVGHFLIKCTGNRVGRNIKVSAKNCFVMDMRIAGLRKRRE